MKIISKIKIHIFFYLVALIAVLTGLFKEFLVLTSIIVIHEIGHIVAAIYFKWNIDKIIILPFGGLTLFNEKINRPLNEELIILLFGPIFQIS
jgi:stage IV sporulation protein FB